MFKSSSVLFVSVLGLYSASIFASVTPFETDGCTGYFEGTIRHHELWHDCCVEHDFYYWVGGTSACFDVADERLRDCVREKGGGAHADLMYYGVRLGHHSPIRLKKKQWGNGLGEPGMDRKLTSEEISLFVDSVEKNQEIKPELKTIFLNHLKR